MTHRIAVSILSLLTITSMVTVASGRETRRAKTEARLAVAETGERAVQLVFAAKLTGEIPDLTISPFWIRL